MKSSDTNRRKRCGLAWGCWPPIARILNTHKGSGKRRHRDVNGSRNHSKQRGGRSDEEEARLTSNNHRWQSSIRLVGIQEFALSPKCELLF